MPLQYDGHYSNASETLQHYLYMTQTRHNNGGLRGDSIPVAPLFCFVFQTQGPRVDFCAAVYLVAEFQKWQFFFFFFFLPFPERVTFMTHQVMPSLTGQSGACSLLTSHFRTWYQVHHLMETLIASRVGTSGKEAFDSCTAETCQS